MQYKRWESLTYIDGAKKKIETINRDQVLFRRARVHHPWNSLPRLGKCCKVANNLVSGRRFKLFKKPLTTLEKEIGTAPWWGNLEA